MNHASEKPVVIVGAGLAGLCCATELHRAGVPFLLLEASDDVGGRVRTDEVDGFLLDRGFQVLSEAYPEARRVLDYASLDLRRFYPGALIRHGGSFRLLGDPLRKPADAPATLFNPAGSPADKLRMLKLRRSLSGLDVPALLAGEDVPTIDYLHRLGFSERIIDVFFKPFLGGIFLDDQLGASARMFRFVFHMFGAGAAAVPAAGMGAIPKQLAAALPGDAVRLHTAVEEVGKDSVVIAGGTRIEARAVVVATDMDTFQRLENPASSRPWLGTTCLYFDAEKPPVSKPVLVLNGEGTGRINTLHVVSRVNPAAAPQGRSLVSVSVIGTPGGDLEGEVRSELRSWFGAEADAWRLIRAYRIPHALPAQPPGVLEPPERPVRTGRGVYVCGDHIDQASIQGAMVSGRRAAEALLQDGLGRG